MATKEIDIPGIGAVTLYKRRGNRSLRLSIGPNGEVRVSQPYWLPYTAGAQFAKTRSDWIEQHRGAQTAGLTHDQLIGKAHRMRFVSSLDVSKVTSRLHANFVEIKYPSQLDEAHADVQKAARSAATRALRLQAEKLLPQRLQQLAEQAGYSYRSVEIRHLKSRWGSCSSQQEITLNLFLMQLPWHLIDYVLLHELAHTRVMRHGPPFWQELEQHAANARQLRKEIGQYHPAFG
ncbi:MAG TPA: SprT family zinc-dependent metalloprotease [Candidatus Saccharimonadales bacterium]|nr:SprT family zinc-dependent metalloprotease [Candidatus Saccharimonadales bacterium]